MYDKIPIAKHSRGKRATTMETGDETEENGNEQEPFIWDDAWELPMDMRVEKEWQRSPLNPFRKSEHLRKKPSSKSRRLKEFLRRLKIHSIIPIFAQIEI